MNIEQVQSIISSLTTALMPAVSVESIQNKDISIYLSDPRDLIGNEDGSEEEFDMSITVKINRPFEPVADFTPTRAELFFMIQFIDCEYNKETDTHIRGRGVWTLSYGSDNNNMHWQVGDISSEMIGSESVGINDEYDRLIQRNVIENIFNQENAVKAEAFADAIFKVGDNLLRSNEATYS